MAVHREISNIAVGQMYPDPENPRFPLDKRNWNPKDEELLVYLANTFDSISVAESIAQHDYFASEPLIVTAQDDITIVLEGNRRLAALHGLARPDLRRRLDHSRRWEAAATARPIDLDFEIPTMYADQRADADPLIGYRHIGSVLAWKPVQRAQFLAHLIDVRGESFADAADTVGEEQSVVRMLYRNQGIIARAKELGRCDLAEQATDRFGIFTAALNRTALRDFVGAARVPDVQEGAPQLDEDRLSHLSELSSWLYGTDDEEKVITESREIGTLAEVVGNELGLEELRRTRDLHGAAAVAAPAGPPPPKRVMRQFATGVGNVRSASRSIELIAGEPRTASLAAELSELLAVVDDAVENAEPAEET